MIEKSGGVVRCVVPYIYVIVACGWNPIVAKEKLKFEQAMARLEKIVGGIEQGKIGLEESIERFAEGMELIKHCRGVLADAELKIQKLQSDADGRLKASDMEEPSDDER